LIDRTLIYIYAYKYVIHVARNIIIDRHRPGIIGFLYLLGKHSLYSYSSYMAEK